MATRNADLTPMKTLFSMTLLLLAFLSSTAFALPLEFTASYNLEKYGIAIARSDYTLQHENNGLRISQHTEAVGLAALLRSDQLDESSFVSRLHDQFLLTEFSYRQDSPDDKNRDIQFKINWIQSGEKLLGKVSGTAYGEELSLNVDEPVWDTSSYLIPLMLNTTENAPPQQYTMMVKGDFKSYTFITHGIEKIEVNGNSIQAIKVERESAPDKSPIFMWLAPSLNNLPVKVDKWKDGKLQLSMLLEQAQFPSDKTMKFKSTMDTIQGFNDSDY